MARARSKQHNKMHYSMADFFHPDTRRESVHCMLKAEGDFIVRKSSNGKAFVVTVLWKGAVRHFQVVEAKNGPCPTYSLGVKEFKTVEELIQFHYLEKIPFIDDNGTRLLNPVKAPKTKSKESDDSIESNGVATHSPTLVNCPDLIASNGNRNTDWCCDEWHNIDTLFATMVAAVQEVKASALTELQKAILATEQKSLQMIAAKRVQMEKLLRDTQHQENSTDNCWNCGRKAGQTCSGCDIARYCGVFCQHKDWSKHKSACGSSSSTVSDNDD